MMCVCDADYVEKRKSPSRRRTTHGPPAAGTAAAFIMGKHEFSDSEDEVCMRSVVWFRSFVCVCRV